MKAYIVILRTQSTVKNYTPFINELRKAHSMLEILPNTWLIISKNSATTWQTKLNPLIWKDDDLFITEVRNNAGGWLSKDIWDWMNQNIPE